MAKKSKGSDPCGPDGYESVSYQKISNGYLVSKSNDSSYTQYFSANKPKLILDPPTEASIKPKAEKVKPAALVKAGGPKPKTTVKAS